MEGKEVSFYISIAAYIYGFYYILKAILQVPDAKEVGRIRKAFGHRENEWLLEWSMKLGSVLPISESGKKKLAIKLKAARIELAPQTFIARSLIKAMIPFCVFLILIYTTSHFFFAFIAVLFLALSISLFFKDFEEIEKIAKDRKKEIEWELPRFLDFIIQEFHYHRDIVRILERYKNNAGGMLKKELEVTVADMKSGNIENALIKMDARLGIASLSSIIRGLLSVIQGEDVIVYFQMLQHDLRLLEYQKLKKIALKRPEKIFKYTALVFISFIAIYLVVFGVVIMKGVAEFSSY